MGGRCYYFKTNKSGDKVKILAPHCTDNFQIARAKFTLEGLDWYSCEQAFQSLKFPLGSKPQIQIYEANPKRIESNHDYGHRVWIMGQTRSVKLQENWSTEGKKVMLLLNISKYIANPSFQEDLLSTKGYELFGQPSSTEAWTRLNPKIQMYIRDNLDSNIDLKEVLENIGKMDAKKVLEVLENV